MISKFRRGETYDTSNIRIIRGLGNILDTDLDVSQDDDSLESISDPKADESVHKVWSPEIDGEPRVISYGDLKFNLNQRILAVLPFYLNSTKEIEKLSVVIGEIIDIISAPVGDEDIPRHIHAKHHKPLPTWAHKLTITDRKENLDNHCQTIVTGYKVKLDEAYHLTIDEIKKLIASADAESRLPFKYDLQFEQSTELQALNQQKLQAATSKNQRKQFKQKFLYDTITVGYRYVMGTEKVCQKFIANQQKILNPRVSPNKFNFEKVGQAEIQKAISKFKLASGTYAQYSDNLNPFKALTLNFVVVDHVVLAPFDIRFVVKVNQSPRRILAFAKLQSFEVRLAYPVHDYYLFHPLDRYVYSVIDSPSNDPQQFKAVTEVIQNLFKAFEVYIVKKSLCNPGDIESVICEDNMGNVKIVKTVESGYSGTFAGSSLASKPEFKGLKFSGISITTYVKGLAYPEGEVPTEHDGYTFFHSKDYYELNLNPDSDTFLEFECTAGKHSLFRNPCPKDVILAVPFNCDREIYRDRINLRWFYPTEEFRLLHLYVKSNGIDPIFQPPHSPSGNNRKVQESKKSIVAKIKYVRSMFKDQYLAIIDLLLFGLSRENPTLNSAFTKRFTTKFFPYSQL